MKFPYKLFLIILTINIVLLSACSNEKEGNVEDYINSNPTEIKITNGQNGNTINIDNTEEKDKIIQQVKKLKIFPTKQEDLKGYNYRIELINNEKLVNTITLMGEVIQFDENYYKVNEQEIKTLETLIDELN